jgi:hypothetical protein
MTHRLTRTTRKIEAEYTITGALVRHLPDQFEADETGRPLDFRPTEAAVKVDLTTGATQVEITGLFVIAAYHNRGFGWARFELPTYTDAAATEYALVRDLVNAIIADHDRGEI